jgi:hypothetical protein
VGNLQFTPHTSGYVGYRTDCGVADALVAGPLPRALPRPSAASATGSFNGCDDLDGSDVQCAWRRLAP